MHGLLLIREAFRFALLFFRPAAAIRAENLVLRRQLAHFLERGQRPRRSTDGERMAIALACRLFDWRSAVAIVKPATVVRWQRELGRMFWRRKSLRGRPPLPGNIRELIVRMDRENPSWGEQRIAHRRNRVTSSTFDSNDTRERSSRDIAHTGVSELEGSDEEGVLDHARPHRVKDDVARQFEQMRVLLNELAVEAALEQMSDAFVSPVEVARVLPVEPLHAARERSLRRLDHHVEVIRHQRLDVDDPVESFHRLGQ